MRVLIVEDDYYKLGQLSSVITEKWPAAHVVTAMGVHSAKECIRTAEPDLIILDMSLPAYDVGKHESGGRPQMFGGREILGYLDFMDAHAQVVVVTQFERFGSDDESIDLASLGSSLREAYPQNYRGIIYYHASSDAWKWALSKLLIEVAAHGN